MKKIASYIPEKEYGEEVKAFVILEEGHSVSSGELIEWSKTRMATYKFPREIEICKTLPMTATGKVLKRALKQYPAQA